jgi:magnesium chelatase subunit I
MVFSANPEDYTNRGRIVTPLKDRIGTVVRTHYPAKLEHGLAITRENAWLERGNGAYEIDVPKYIFEIIEETIRLARQSPHINQQSGVSVRTSIACSETAVSSAERRAILLSERKVVPRICDLANIAASCRGKIELLLAEDESAEDKLIQSLVGEAVKNIFENYMSIDELDGVVEQFRDGKNNLETGDALASGQLVAQLDAVGELRNAAADLCRAAERNPDDDHDLASAAEFVLEALYVNNRLSKYAYRSKTFFKR